MREESLGDDLGLIPAALEATLVRRGHGDEENLLKLFKQVVFLEFGDERVVEEGADFLRQFATAAVFHLPDELLHKGILVVEKGTDPVIILERARRQKGEELRGSQRVECARASAAGEKEIENQLFEHDMIIPMALFSNLFNKEDSHALGIDIGSSAIKIVQLKKRNGQAVLETYGELALGPYAGLSVGQAVQLPGDKIAGALTDLMKEKEVNVTTKKSGLSIPFASSLMSVVEMPDVGASKLATMIPLEARKYIPVPIQEVMLDWSVIPKSEVRDESPETGLPTDGAFAAPEVKGLPKVDVLMVAIHNETIARYQDIVTRAGLEASFFEIEVFSTMRSVLTETLKPVLIIDMGAASTKLYIIERGIVRTSHTVNRGAQDITAGISQSLSVSIERAEIIKREMGLLGPEQAVIDVATLVLDYIFGEVNSTLLAFEKKSNRPVAKVILIGGGAALKGVLEVSKNNLKMEVELGLPFNKVAAPAFLENILRETGPEFAVAIGLALRKLSEEK